MIRTIITPDTKTISVEIPENYLGRKIEVIAFALDEGVQQPSKKAVHGITGVFTGNSLGWICGDKKASKKAKLRNFEADKLYCECTK